MAKGKYTSKFTSVTAELFNDYYEDTTTVIRRKIASNATSQKTNSVSTKQNKAVLSSKPQKKQTMKKQNNANKKVITQSLKQTASFLNNKQKYQQEFPTLGQSYKSQTVKKPQQQLKQKPQQPKKLASKSTAPKTYRSPATYTTKQTEELLRQFYSICQSYNGITYFGKAEFQNNTWSKNRQGQWVNSASSIALKNAPVVRRIQRQASAKKQPVQQKAPVRQSSFKTQPVMRMNKQQANTMFTHEFSEICQTFSGMTYFGNSSLQANTWSKNRQGQWVSKASSLSLKNAPVVRRIQRQASSKKQPVQQKAPIRQAPVKKQPIQQKAPVRQAPVKKQQIQQRKMKKTQRSMKPVVNNAIVMEQKQMNQKCIVAQQNASMKLQQQILKQYQEKQQQLEKKKMIEQQQKIRQQQQKKLQKKVSEKKMKSVKQTVKQPTNIKKQQLMKEKNRVQQKALNKNNKLNKNVKRNVRQMSKSQAKKLRKKQQLVNAINKRIQELVAEKHQKQLFSQMVKQKAEQILEEKHEAAIQKSMNNFKQTQGNKLREKESYEKQKKQIQKKLAKQKGQIKQKVNKSSTSQIVEAQKKKQLAELRKNLTPQQFSKLQSIMQQKGNITKEQNERQLQSEQAKKNWQEQVKKMKARQQDVQQKQQKQTLVKRRLENIMRKLTPKQQENLMNKLKMKEQQKEKAAQLKNRQPRANNNNKKFVKRAAPVKQAPIKQAPVRKAPVKQVPVKQNKSKKTEVWTFVNYNKNNKVQKPVQKTVQKPVQKTMNVKQFKTVSSRKLNASEIRMLNSEFNELCNVFESTRYITYSNYKTWSKNKSGNYISNASVISARNAPRITKGLSKQMFYGKNMKTQNVRPQQVSNKKSNRSRY